jgi:uncharacterized protein (TIGR02996 family)
LTPDAFLETIRQNPDDDGPRLVYADWLEERGDPLGEFIRVQCELARVERDELHEVQNLQERQEQLLTSHRTEWLASLARFNMDESFKPHFHRGFVERINVDADVFIGEHERIGMLCPMLRSAVLFRVAEFVEGVTLCPLLGRVSKLGIADWIDYDHAQMLANSRHFINLKSIWLWVCDYAQTLESGLALIDAPGLNEINLVHLYDSTHDGELPDDETRWRIRVEAELNERTMADRGEIFHVTSSSNRFFNVGSDSEIGFATGKIADRQCLVVLDQYDVLHIVSFDHQGKRLGHESRWPRGLLPRIIPEDTQPLWLQQVQDFMKTELGFEPCPIRIREFCDPCGLAVHQFPERLWEAFGALQRPPAASWHRTFPREIHDWVESGQFVLDWGAEHFFANHDDFSSS